MQLRLRASLSVATPARPPCNKSRRWCQLVPRAVDEQLSEASTSFVDTDLVTGLQGDPSRRVTLSARKTASLKIVEGDRPLGEYMALPASQYSVLDANKIERLDSETFRCHVGGIKFFNFCLEPVLTLRVQPHPQGCDISMLACKLDGSGVVRAQNAKFASRMNNRVRWAVSSDGAGKELVSETMVEVDLQVPRWFVLPIPTIKSTGDKVMAQVLVAAVPKFLQQLERDYQAWASGDDTRKPVGSGDSDDSDW